MDSCHVRVVTSTCALAAMADQSATVLGRPSRTAGPSRPEEWGPDWRLFDAAPRCGKAARDWIADVLGQHRGLAEPDDAALVVSELFTNAVLHGPGGQVLVAHYLWRDGARIVVCDGGGTSTPHLRRPERSEEGGRGLQVVDMLAAAWGQFRAGPAAQVVWCDLGKPLDLVLTDPWGWLPVAIANIARTEPCHSTVPASDRIAITGRA
jgi:hypothetical protein